MDTTPLARRVEFVPPGLIGKEPFSVVTDGRHCHSGIDMCSISI